MTKKIKAKCHICNTVGHIPEDYQGKIKCPKCKSEFYIDEKLINVNGQQCRICGKQVKLKIQ